MAFNGCTSYYSVAESALFAIAPVYGITPESAAQVVPSSGTAAAQFRRPNGSYRFENRFRYLIAAA